MVKNKKIIAILITLTLAASWTIIAVVLGDGSMVGTIRPKYSDGKLTFSTYAPAATTGVRYRTIGFIAWFEANGKKYSTRIRIDNQYNSPPDENGYITTMFEIDFFGTQGNTIMKRFMDKYPNEPVIIDFFSKSNTLYLESIISIIEAGATDTNGHIDEDDVLIGECYTSYDGSSVEEDEPDNHTDGGIKNARAWTDSTKLALGQYYSMPTPFTAPLPPKVEAIPVPSEILTGGQQTIKVAVSGTTPNRDDRGQAVTHHAGKITELKLSIKCIKNDVVQEVSLSKVFQGEGARFQTNQHEFEFKIDTKDKAFTQYFEAKVEVKYETGVATSAATTTQVRFTPRPAAPTINAEVEPAKRVTSDGKEKIILKVSGSVPDYDPQKGKIKEIKLYAKRLASDAHPEEQMGMPNPHRLLGEHSSIQNNFEFEIEPDNKIFTQDFKVTCIVIYEASDGSLRELTESASTTVHVDFTPKPDSPEVTAIAEPSVSYTGGTQAIKVTVTGNVPSYEPEKGKIKMMKLYAKRLKSDAYPQDTEYYEEKQFEGEYKTASHTFTFNIDTKDKVFTQEFKATCVVIYEASDGSGATVDKSASTQVEAEFVPKLQPPIVQAAIEPTESYTGGVQNIKVKVSGSVPNYNSALSGKIVQLSLYAKAVPNAVNISQILKEQPFNGEYQTASFDFIFPIDTKNKVFSQGFEAYCKVTYESGISLTSTNVLVQVEFKEPPALLNYTSIPGFWSELKQGSPYNEAFEAMAGVPTTRSLYFATGGSEFIADIVAKWYPNEAATRKYKSYYGGTSCEYKAGDTAPNKTLGGESVNLHNGGTYSKTWTGSIPNDAVAVTADGTGTVTATCTAVPNLNAYNADLAAADTFASQVNGTVLSHKAASDNTTRTKSGWSAGVSPSQSLPQTTTATSSSYHTETVGTPPNQTTKQVGDPVTATASPSGAGSYTITVTWTVPAHCICGPCCQHELPPIEDNWEQTITYDILKIEKVHIWKIDKSKVNGMTALIGTDEVTANIVQGEPNVFSNIAASESSQQGRLRYSLEPSKHDNVLWYEGTRTAHCNKQNQPWGDGIEYNNTNYSNTPNYHVSNSSLKDKSTNEYKKFEEHRLADNQATVISDFVILQTSSGDQAMLYFQKPSGMKDSQEHFEKVVNTVEEMWHNNPQSAAKWKPEQINTGCYNGEFYNQNTKYNGSGSRGKAATIFDNDPAGTISRPGAPSADLRLMAANIDIIDTIPNGEYITGNSKVFYTKVLSHGEASQMYTNQYSSAFGAWGLEYPTAYSKTHQKINNIVVHNPVSTESAMILPINAAMDQRTPSTQALGGNLQQDTQELVKRLKAVHPYQNFIHNGTASQTDEDGNILNWKKTGTAVFSSANQQFGIQTASDTAAGYYTDIKAIPNKAYTITAALSVTGGSGRILIEELASTGILLQTKSFTGGSFNFTTHAQAAAMRITIQKYSSAGILIADDIALRLKDGDTAEWVPMGYTYYKEKTVPNPDYVPAYQIPNPAYVPPAVQAAQTLTSGSWTASVNGNVTITVYGYGSYYQHDDHEQYYTIGGRGTGTIWVNKGDTLSISGAYIYKNGSCVMYATNGGGGSSSSCSAAQNSAANNNGTIWYSGGVSNVIYSSSYNSIQVPSITIPGNGEPEFLTVPAKGTPTITIKTEVNEVQTEPPSDWYETVLVTIPAKPTVNLMGIGTVTAGEAILVDHKFQIYFPNRGNFYGDGSFGISKTTDNRGKGFINNMDTTEYTSKKLVKFGFHVIYEDKLYKAGEEISLPINQEIYDFYLPLANKEAVSAYAEFSAIAINGTIMDNILPANKTRYEGYSAKHTAIKKYNIDIVGRIGNLVIEDTGDFRFSNFFKTPVTPTTWFIENIVKDVKADQQNNIIGSTVDIRGENAAAWTNYLNTYGTLDFLQRAPYKFPLSPDINPISALRKQPLRIGYSILMDIQTIGNYYSHIQVIPYYYSLNLLDGSIAPVDVYVKDNAAYKAINRFGAAVPGWDTNSVYNYQIMLNWEEEAARRNYHNKEKTITEYVRDNSGYQIPMGKYHSYGNAQVMYPDEGNRSFIGSSKTYGSNKNPGNVLTEYEYNRQAQRWHFSFKLPSSAVFVPVGQQVTDANIKAVMNNNSVIILAADIKSIGDTYVLQYKHPNGNGSVSIADTMHNLNNIPYPVIAIYSSNKSSADDLSTEGTH